MGHETALLALEASLAWYAGRRGQGVLDRWGPACPLLATVRLASLRDLPSWVWSLRPCDANNVLRALVGQAQAGDAVAAVVVLACLRPGLCALAARTGLSVDELLSDVAVEVLRFPVERRASVGQVLLDVRNRIGRRRAKERDVLVGDTRVALEDVQAPGELGVELSAAEQLIEVVATAWRSGDLATDQARLILETRIAGEPVASAAARRSVSRTAAYQRRHRAEARLARAGTAVVGMLAPRALQRPAAWVGPACAAAAGWPNRVGRRGDEELT